MMALVKTNNTAYDLCKDQKDFYDKHLIKISTKRIDMEHVSKIGCLTETCVKLVLAECYIEDISSRLKILSGMIDVKKECTFEKGKRSKAFSVCTTEKKALKINEEFSRLTHTRHQFILCQKTTSEDRLASMHQNEIINVKARCESLCNASLKERILVSNRCYEQLETVIMNANYNGSRLFLVAE